MKLRRGQRPAVDTEAVALIAELYLTYRESAALCARLVDLRFTGTPVAEVAPEALAGARRVAYAARATVAAITDERLLERVSAELEPSAVLPALGRLGYTLVALAEEAPEPEALLTQSELAGPQRRVRNRGMGAAHRAADGRIGGRRAMNELRRSLVDRSGLDPELSADAAFIVTHQASAGFLLAGLSRTYPELLERYQSEGPTAELDGRGPGCRGHPRDRPAVPAQPS